MHETPYKHVLTMYIHTFDPNCQCLAVVMFTDTPHFGKVKKVA